MSETMRSDAGRGIAIVGMAAVLPGAADLTAFWTNAVNGVSSIAAQAAEAGNKASSWAGVIPPVPVDASRYSLDASTLRAMPPAHLLALEVTRRALLNARYEPQTNASTSMLFAGADDQGEAIETSVARALRLASLGRTSTVARSSLDALDQACGSLRAGASELVVCGAIELQGAPPRSAPGPVDSTTSLDADATDATRGEAVVAIVLKRLADAERDHDRIYAVIRGSAIGPNAGAALEAACGAAGVPALSVGLIEAQGMANIDALQSALRRSGAPGGSATLTSATPQIGDSGIAAGLVGIVRAALALQHRVLPPATGVASPNPALSPDDPLVLNTASMPWFGSVHRAAVSVTGADGASHCVVLDAGRSETPECGLELWPSELFLLRGSTLEDAYKKVDSLLDCLSRDNALRLRDLSRTVSIGDEMVQIAFVASSLDDLHARLESLRESGVASGVFFARDAKLAAGSKLAFLFPGQGSQRPGMLRDLFVAFPRLQHHLEAGSRWAGLILPPTPWSDAEKIAQRDRLTATRAAQPALGVAGMAMADLLLGLGIRPDALGGHSYGELVALCVAGVFSEADLMQLSEARARCIIQAVETAGDPGTMAAISAGREAVAALIEPFEGVVIANENSPEQTVISGITPSVQAAVAAIKAGGLSAVQLQVACAFHSPVVAAGSTTFREHLDRVEMAPPRLLVFSNTTAEPYPEGAGNVRARLAEHIARSVQFVREIEAMYAAGVRIFVEAGPGRVLTGLVAKTLGARPYLALNPDHATNNGITQLLTVLAQLAVNGVELDIDPLYAARDAAIVDLEAPAAPRELTVWVDGRGVRSGPTASDA
ncbi:MAG TPA: acyltransferase domain-containing protein [Dehalococcoidia bacterium]|nr:acyltransferase domain-containing protein [Dehalococcoidia bacterium]